MRYIQSAVKKTLCIILAILIISLLMFSQIYISNHIHHQCSGENCPICNQIDFAIHILNQIVSGGEFFFVIFTLVMFVLGKYWFSSLISITKSLFILKVRLNN
ncbi:hypothetical protein SAMN05421659_12335 [[Clostridium] fimetarium]|uniref:Uncharacterized protein n=1 Tax=[Clostridium] fimetarium TaxID=99656 RepID=A0A1I0RTY5_9FIRM|nr:hypothetical protein SAMN05421659_12335 [[Clostridium] fimetarium]